MLVGVLMLYPVADPVVWFVRINLSIPPPPPPPKYCSSTVVMSVNYTCILNRSLKHAIAEDHCAQYEYTRKLLSYGRLIPSLSTGWSRLRPFPPPNQQTGVDSPSPTITLPRPPGYINHFPGSVPDIKHSCVVQKVIQTVFSVFLHKKKSSATKIYAEVTLFGLQLYMTK